MGFRTGAYAKVWQVKPKSNVNTELRISISRKDKQTGNYEQDFSGFVYCIGTVCAQKAAKLAEGARIKLGDVDVSTKYDKEKGVTYTSYKCFSFEAEESQQTANPSPSEPEPSEPSEDDLPF